MLASLYFKNNNEIFATFYRNQKLVYIKGCYIPNNVGLNDFEIRIKNLIDPDIKHIITFEYAPHYTPFEKVSRMKIMNVIKAVTSDFNHNVNITKYPLNEVLNAYKQRDDFKITNDYDISKLLADYHFSKKEKNHVA